MIFKIECKTLRLYQFYWSGGNGLERGRDPAWAPRLNFWEFLLTTVIYLILQWPPSMHPPLVYFSIQNPSIKIPLCKELFVCSSVPGGWTLSNWGNFSEATSGATTSPDQLCFVTSHPSRITIIHRALLLCLTVKKIHDGLFVFSDLCLGNLFSIFIPQA